MSATNETIDAFLQKTGLHHGAIDEDAVQQRFLADMEAGLRGTASSLAMIPTFMDPSRPVLPGQSVIVLDAGGTNLRVGSLSFDEARTPSIRRLTKHRMPASQALMSKDEFFDRFVALIQPLADAGDRIGFCFSYPAEITPDHDARLMYWSKEIQAPEVEGELIGSNIARRLAAAGCPKQIVVLNDTVATLLAAKSRAGEDHYAAFIGFILGTGTNTAYVEQNQNISKRNDLDPRGCQIINIEAGNFNGCSRGPIDDAFDLTTSDPGRYRHEKMVAGAYLGSLTLRVLRAAGDEGLFSASAARVLRSWDRLETIALTRYLAGKGATTVFADEAFDPGDHALLHRLITAVVQRAAWLAAINLAAVCVKTGAGHDPARPICINADGSTFHKVPGLKTAISAHLTRLLKPHSIFFELVHIENAPLVGAGVAGLIV